MNNNFPTFTSHSQSTQQPHSHQRTQQSQQEFVPSSHASQSPFASQQMQRFSANSQIGALKQQAHQQMLQRSHNQASQQAHANQRKTSGPEFCPKCCEQNVGYIESSREIVCNKCIFDKKLGGVRFTALVTKELRQEFQQAFQQYKDGCNQVGQVDPNVVKQRATIIVQKFFGKLAAEVKTLQDGVNQKIKSSDSLKDLERILEQNREMFPAGREGTDNFELEKKKFDEKIAKGRFAYLVKRQEFYEQLIGTLDHNSTRMRQTVDASTQQMQRVLRFEQNDSVIQEKLTQIVKENIDLDMAACDISVPLPPVSPVQRAPPVQNLKPAAQPFAQSGPTRENSIFQSLNQPASPQQKPAQVTFSSSQVSQSPTSQMSQQPSSHVSQQPVAPPQSGMAPQQSLQAHVPNSAPNGQAACPKISPAQPSPTSAAGSMAAPVAESPRSSVGRQSSQQAQVIDDDVMIVDEVVKAPTKVKELHYVEGAELDFPSFFKLKAMSLLKLMPGRGWAKIAPVQRYRAKCVQAKDQSVYVLGGAKDEKSVEALQDVHKYSIQGSKVFMDERASMLLPRSNYGATINAHMNEIYVAGGNTTGGVMTSRCEAYDIDSNVWRELPRLNEEKTSVSLSVLAGRWLYCIGGYAKDSSGGCALSTVEMLDLQAPNGRWEVLAAKLPTQMLDMGSVPLNDRQLLLFGGWNKTSSQTALILNRQWQGDNAPWKHTFVHVAAQLEKPDYFMVTGVAMRVEGESHKFKVCGHASLFTFNQRENAFEGSSNM